jgi:3-hydroxyisobutyrate dehydrogenase-like beta-hydroxyacid dehydrogenase
MKDRIGFVGLGAMGFRMVPYLLKAGYEVFVSDLNKDAVDKLIAQGAIGCSDAGRVADHAQIVLTCLPTPEIVEEVVLGEDGLAFGEKMKVFVDHSTVGPSTARKLASALAERGIAALDAPLAGGVAGAAAGTLSVMVSGDADAYRRAEPVFKSFGKNVVHVGDQPGLGQTLKLVNNMIVGATMIATAEAVLFGIKGGLDARTLLDMLNVSTARSFTSEAIFEQAVMTRSFDFGFRMDLMRKDVRLFLSEAEQAGVPTFTCSVVKQFFDHAIARGHAAEDMTNVIKELESMAGVRIGA